MLRRNLRNYEIDLRQDLRHFSTPSKSWLYLAGRAGYVVVRDEDVVDAIVTVLN